MTTTATPLRIFILDDEVGSAPRNAMLKALARHELTVVKNRVDAQNIYKPGFDLLLLDHDMRGFFDSSDHPSTAYHFVKFMVLLAHKVKPRIILHSQNPDGRTNMKKLLKEYGFQSEEYPFSPGYVRFLETI